MATTHDIVVEIPKIDVRKLALRVVGDSPLITHRWSEKAKRQILDKQMKKGKQAKEAKDPFRDFIDSLYWLSEQPTQVTEASLAKASFGFPCVGFKAAAVTAASETDGMKMTQARRRFHVDGEFAELKGLPTMREDMVRIGMGTADIRYRGCFQTWETELTISYNAASISPEQIVNLFNLAGFGVGIGEWRCEKDGSYGRFHIG